MQLRSIGRKPARPLWLVACHMIAFGLFATGCEHGHDHDAPKDEHACVHWEKGPEVNRSASAERIGAPEGFHPHTLVVAALVDVGGGNGGFLTLTVEDAGEYRLLVAPDIAVEILQEGTDTALAAENTGTPEGCAAASRVVVYDLPAGSHSMKIGPTTASTLRFTLEEAEHAH